VVSTSTASDGHAITLAVEEANAAAVFSPADQTDQLRYAVEHAALYAVRAAGGVEGQVAVVHGGITSLA